MHSNDTIRQKIWEISGMKRRLLLLALIIFPSLLAAQVMYRLLPPQSGLILNIIIIALFAVLFCWISVGFWSSLAGMLLLLRRIDRFSITKRISANTDIPDDARTALLFPVYNEDPHKVAEGVRTVLQSLHCLNQDSLFDIFILSDTTNPEIWVQEEEVWHNLCLHENAFGRIFYRHRKYNLKRKSGNIADFCRRWGMNYRYMIVFDADSLMSGTTLIRMVQSMEEHPEIGILQTPPKAVFSRSLISRVQQFANHLYGPIFAAGLHYWQLGEAQYWGHNAIIRIKPFIQHCQLPGLPGKSPLGGDILSHDFVESALMRRAGYGVWLAYDMDGSYEQNPPTLIDELVRDRRWCQGNLQHSRLIFTRGFFPTHRALFINGILSYGSALLWFFFLLASSAQAITTFFILPEYFPSGPSLFPDWPKYFPTWALTLLSSTIGLLFLPKFLTVLLIMVKGGVRNFGGIIRISLSTLGEMIVSGFLAPVRMLFHSYFVISTLLGFSTGWNTQNRDDSGTTWGTAIRFHWWGTVFGLIWGLLIYIVSPGFFLWLSPVILGLALSIPLSVWTSRVSLGLYIKRIGLFLTPVEIKPANEIIQLEESLHKITAMQEKGFTRAVVIPSVFALHLALSSNKRHNSPQKTKQLHRLIDIALNFGPDALSLKEKNTLLNDPDSLKQLHRMVWMLDERHAAQWGIK